MARRLFQFGLVASGVILIAVLVLWPRSCFFADKWWVRYVTPIQSPRLPPANVPLLPQSSMSNAYGPSGWGEWGEGAEGAALMSSRGRVLRIKSIPSFSPGQIVTERPTELLRPSWLPENNGRWLAVPYWCIALVAAILPAIWWYRTREQCESRARFRFGIRGLLALTAACALALTGYVHLGSGGVILVVAAALASYTGIVLLRRPSSSGRASTVAQRVFGAVLLCIAVYHAYLFVNCYAHVRAWAPYNSTGT